MDGFRLRVTAWWTILRISLEERLVYRGDFALGTLMRFLPIITQIFLWWAVFDAMANSAGDSLGQTLEPETVNSDAAAANHAATPAAAGAQGQRLIRGYAYPDFVAYYLLTMLARAFSSMPALASGIAQQVRDGEIKKFLIQPVDLLGFLLLSRIAHKLAYYSVAVGPFALVFFLCRGYFTTGLPDLVTCLAFVSSLIMGFVLGFFLEASIGLIGFWFLEVSSLLFVYMLFSFFLSGHMFPLDMLPDPWRWMVEWLPLRYLAYFPSAVFLGKVTGVDLVRGLVLEAAWILFFIFLSRYLLNRGLERYSGFGG